MKATTRKYSSTGMVILKTKYFLPRTKLLLVIFKSPFANYQKTGKCFGEFPDESLIRKPISCHWFLSIPPENIRKLEVF